MAIKIILLFALSLMFCSSSAWAMTYYISPAGNNDNNGLSTEAPKLTFEHVIPLLAPGDTLTLLNGVYTASNSGNILITDKSGTAGLPITIRAQNQRQAQISRNGDSAMRILRSNYWTIDGLVFSSGDNASTAANQDVTAVWWADHIIIRNSIFMNNNRYFNTVLLGGKQVTNSLYEDNEFYGYHRHAITLSYCDSGCGGGFSFSENNVIRRNYANGRGRGYISGGFANECACSDSDTAISIYPASFSIVENNIAEGVAGARTTLFTIQAVDQAIGNQFLGNICLGCYGSYIQFRTDGGNTTQPTNTTIRNGVYIGIGPTGYIRAASNINTTFDHLTVMNGAFRGISCDISFVVTTASCTISNSLVANNGEIGIYFQSDRLSSYSAVSNNAFNNVSGNYSAMTSSSYSPNPQFSINPQMGTCYLWVPDGSPMKGAGTGGSDMGATVLYRYQNGALTNIPLWDQITGEFPHGAIIAGVNDVAGRSLFDVHKRLNVNRNGCLFPSSYTSKSADVTSPAAPQNVRVF